MKIYVRNREGLGQRGVDCYSWSYCNDNDHQSSFDCYGDLTAYDNGILLVPFPEVGGRHVSIIKTITPKDETSKITTEPFINYFDRLCYWNYNTDNVGRTVTQIITDNWINQADSVYKADWIDLDITESGEFPMPELDDNMMFNVKEFLLSLQRTGRLYLSALPTTTGVKLTDHAEQSEVSNIFIGVGYNKLISETYSNQITAKVTNNVDDAETNYYLHSDGSFDTTDVDRVYGKWEKVFAKTEEEIADIFNANKYEHKIAFYSNIPKRAGSLITIRTEDGRIIKSVVTCVKIESKDNRIRYECGRLKTTLTDILGGINNGK